MPRHHLSSGASTPPQGLEERVTALERKERTRELYVLMKEKKDLLNSEMKSSDNIIIKGMKYAIKDVQKDEAAEEKFREKTLQVLVDQGLVPQKKLFHIKGDEKGRILRGVLRHCHPLGSKDNSSVIVAFLESWFVATIVNKLAHGKRLKDGIRINQHVPPIIEALRNEALKARRALLAADRSRKLVVKTTIKAPWIRLVEVTGGRKKEVEFEVEDGRLVFPALTLARIERDDKDGFVQMAFLPPAEREAIRPGIVKPSAEMESVDHDLGDMDLS